MLDNIKSIFFLKYLFSYCLEKSKLNIVKYSKCLQNKIDINIFYYKIYSGKYIIYKSKGFGEEYNSLNNELLYKGEFKNGERNGKGKVYENNKLRFVGEYLKGKRNGKGKEYDIIHDIIKFEGEYLNGEKNGKGKEYHHHNGKVKFIGEYLKGERNGKGKQYDYDGNLIFEGFFLNGNRIILKEKTGNDNIRTGKIFASEYNYDGKLKFEGEYLNGKKWNGIVYDHKNQIKSELKNGNGFIPEYHYYTDRTQFVGEYKDGERFKGKEYDYLGYLFYEGEFKNGLKNGKGKGFFNGDKIIFEGEYLNNKKNGKGKEYDENGKLIFEGEYCNDHRKFGKTYLNGKLEYEGEFLFYRKWKGKGYDQDGNIIYELKNGNGKVKEYEENNYLKFEGEYLDGKKNGKGKEYEYKGKLVFEGEFLNDKKWTGRGYNLAKNDSINYELKNGNGFITEYYNLYTNINIYLGEYLNGQRNGKGKECILVIGKFNFDGEYLNGKRNGKGKEYSWFNGRIKFEGEY